MPPFSSLNTSNRHIKFSPQLVWTISTTPQHPAWATNRRLPSVCMSGRRKTLPHAQLYPLKKFLCIAMASIVVRLSRQLAMTVRRRLPFICHSVDILLYLLLFSSLTWLCALFCCYTVYTARHFAAPLPLRTTTPYSAAQQRAAAWPRSARLRPLSPPRLVLPVKNFQAIHRHNAARNLFYGVASDDQHSQNRYEK